MEFNKSFWRISEKNHLLTVHPFMLYDYYIQFCGKEEKHKFDGYKKN